MIAATRASSPVSVISLGSITVSFIALVSSGLPELTKKSGSFRPHPSSKDQEFGGDIDPLAVDCKGYLACASCLLPSAEIAVDVWESRAPRRYFLQSRWSSARRVTLGTALGFTAE
jgi:hypothetical protein